ncbi:MAG: hypothetical protein GOVbin1096_125 [Prokaryotic dsDNA virus sp.]|jgi:hypothetical protein|nr:MAG: hypothetical protein GOVbin1096_125 [Prokaryotic dsDNA virus sp.]|tara:strand:- start:31588 stop:31803 length:216 start_codon:yes stop_codon:yes gene_type:complete
MKQPAIFSNMNAVECQSLIFQLEDELEMLEIHYKNAVNYGATLVAEQLNEEIAEMRGWIKEAEEHRDKKGV